MRKELGTLDAMSQFYQAIETHVWDIARSIKNHLRGSEDKLYEEDSWEFMYGDVYVRFRKPEYGFNECDYVYVNFPAKLIWENNEGIMKYLETLEKTSNPDD